MSEPELSATHKALRDNATSLVVRTTGLITMAATVNGFTRSDGFSFENDSLLSIGMEVTPTGFTDNTPGVIESFSAAGALEIVGGRTAQVSGSGRALIVKPPSLFFKANEGSKRNLNRHYLEESFVPATRALMTTSEKGYMIRTGLYFLRWYGLLEDGALGLETCCDAMVNKFDAGFAVIFADGSRLRMREDQLPEREEPVRRDTHRMCIIKIPWQLEYFRN